MTGVRKIISGGQVGADIAGLRAAKFLGLETGGWLPYGWRTKDGPRPEYEQLYGCEQYISESYPGRTCANVRDSDATVRFAMTFNSAGERCTLNAIKAYGRPHFDVQLLRIETGRLTSDVTPASFGLWLLENEVKTLNVAGNARRDLEDFVENFIIKAMTGRRA